MKNKSEKYRRTGYIYAATKSKIGTRDDVEYVLTLGRKSKKLQGHVIVASSKRIPLAEAIRRVERILKEMKRKKKAVDQHYAPPKRKIFQI